MHICIYINIYVYIYRYRYIHPAHHIRNLHPAPDIRNPGPETLKPDLHVCLRAATSPLNRFSMLDTRY